MHLRPAHGHLCPYHSPHRTPAPGGSEDVSARETVRGCQPVAGHKRNRGKSSQLPPKFFLASGGEETSWEMVCCFKPTLKYLINI